MNFAELLGLTGAVAATAMSGGTAAPLVAGLEGAGAAAGAAGASAAGAAGATGASLVPGAVTGAVGDAAAMEALAAGTAGGAAPTGAAAITQPLAAAGVPSGAGIQVPAGSMVNGNILQGGMSVPSSSTVAGGGGGSMSMAPNAGGQVFTGLESGAGAGKIATAAATPMKTSTGLTAQQTAQLAKLAGGDQQQSGPGGGGGAPAAKNQVSPMAQFSAPGVGARPSLAQLLYGRK